MLLPGDPARPFSIASSVNPKFTFDTVAGRYVVLSFLCSTKLPYSKRLLELISPQRERFDVTNAIFFALSVDGDDRNNLRQEHPGLIHFWDEDLKVSCLYGVTGSDLPAGAESATGHFLDSESARQSYTPRTFIFDQALRVIASIPFAETPEAHVAQIVKVLDGMPPLKSLVIPPPVLIVPYVLEPDLCQTLIDYYQTRGGADSGFMRDVNGKTVGITDHAHKRRMDCEIADEPLIRTLHERLQRRVVPAIRQAYQFNVNRIERHIVACYDADQGAHFRAHRDNTTLGTAHRRFAVTINLNSPDYEGGEIWFPEFSPRRYKAPSGSAIVFSCSLLHEVPRVTRGIRYAFLPFLYDDAAAAVRERNRRYLGDLSGAGGSNPKGRIVTDCSADGITAGVSNATAPVIDGSCGCGNPNGCGTCLSSATYQLGVARSR